MNSRFLPSARAAGWYITSEIVSAVRLLAGPIASACAGMLFARRTAIKTMNRRLMDTMDTGFMRAVGSPTYSDFPSEQASDQPLRRRRLRLTQRSNRQDQGSASTNRGNSFRDSPA